VSARYSASGFHSTERRCNREQDPEKNQIQLKVSFEKRGTLCAFQRLKDGDWTFLMQGGPG
jgi:hypothetical protein